jgi:hypothetical protein
MKKFFNDSDRYYRDFIQDTYDYSYQLKLLINFKKIKRF